MHINEKKMINALAEGKSKAEAGRLSGSKDKNPTKMVDTKLKNNPKLVLKLKEKMEEKMQMAMSEMTQEKAEVSTFKDLMKSIEIGQKIVNLEEGRPTAINENRSMSKADMLDKIKEMVGDKDLIDVTSPRIVEVEAEE